MLAGDEPKYFIKHLLGDFSTLKNLSALKKNFSLHLSLKYIFCSEYRTIPSLSWPGISELATPFHIYTLVMHSISPDL